MSLIEDMPHLCDLYGIKTVDNDGSPITKYVKINAKPIKCWLDLIFSNPGKDSLWTATAARVDDRTGTLFLPANAPIKAGLRLVMVKGPKGSFQVQGAINEAWDWDSLSHFEVGVVEISSLQFRGELNMDNNR